MVRERPSLPAMNHATLAPVSGFYRHYESIDLYDADAGWFDNDDFLGRATVFATEAGMGERTVFFTEDDAQYTLTYRVD